MDDKAKGDMPAENPNADPDYKPAVTGGVIDEAHDGRLKENREAGITKGTTEHSSQAPFVDEDASGSVNANSDLPAQDQYRGDGIGKGADGYEGDGAQMSEESAEGQADKDKWSGEGEKPGD